MAEEKLIIDRIFDPKEGWDFTVEEVPIERHISEDGNPYYLLTVDGTQLLVVQRTQWAQGTVSSVSPVRIVVRGWISGAEITDAMVWLRANYDNDHFPEVCIDEEGLICIGAALPMNAEFPLDWARRQLQVTMALVSETVDDMVKAINTKAPEPEVDSDERSSGWDTAKEVATVAGAFLGAFMGKR